MSKNKTKNSKTDAKADTIAARIMLNKQAVLLQLKKNPVIQSACHRANIDKSTVYRWMKQDTAFAEILKETQKEGHEFICDMAESQLIKKIGDGDRTSCIFYLKTHRKNEFSEQINYEHRIENRSELSVEDRKLMHAGMIKGLAGFFYGKLTPKDTEEAILKNNELIDKGIRKNEDYKEKLRQMIESKNTEEE